MKLQSKKFKILLISSALYASICGVAADASPYNIGSEAVSGSRATPRYTDNGSIYGPFDWNYSYTRSFNGTAIRKDVEIQFLFDSGIDIATQALFKTNAERNIERTWNGKYQVIDTINSMIFPVVVDVTTTGPFNQIVQVHPGSGRDDMLNWYLDSSASVNAHEFGHMLGLFDEYIGGAVNQYPDPLLSDDGLMGLGALNASPVMYSRYYQQYLDYVTTLNPYRSFRLDPVSVPAPLVFLGLPVAFSYTRRLRKLSTLNSTKNS